MVCKKQKELINLCTPTGKMQGGEIGQLSITSVGGCCFFFMVRITVTR